MYAQTVAPQWGSNRWESNMNVLCPLGITTSLMWEEGSPLSDIWPLQIPAAIHVDTFMELLDGIKWRNMVGGEEENLSLPLLLLEPNQRTLLELSIWCPLLGFEYSKIRPGAVRGNCGKLTTSLGVFPILIFCCFPFRILTWWLHEFCSGFLVELSGRYKVECAYSILSWTKT